MNTTTRQFRTKITKAFKILRLLGYWCKQNHACCSSCGWEEVPDNMENVVFYHAQDNDNLLMNEHFIYFAWKGDHEVIMNVLELCDITATCENPEKERIRSCLPLPQQHPRSSQ